jgi:hypothetical protein
MMRVVESNNINIYYYKFDVISVSSFVIISLERESVSLVCCRFRCGVSFCVVIGRINQSVAERGVLYHTMRFLFDIF